MPTLVTPCGSFGGEQCVVEAIQPESLVLICGHDVDLITIVVFDDRLLRSLRSVAFILKLEWVIFIVILAAITGHLLLVLLSRNDFGLDFRLNYGGFFFDVLLDSLDFLFDVGLQCGCAVFDCVACPPLLLEIDVEVEPVSEVGVFLLRFLVIFDIARRWPPNSSFQ